MSKRRNKKIFEEGVSYWQSYSDMMAAVLLVLVLLLTFSMFESKSQIEKEKNALEEQQKLVAEQQEKLEEQQEMLDRIIGVRAELIEALKSEFESSGLNVKVDSQTGSIIFDSNILYDVNQTIIKSEGQEFLREFFPRYFKVLLGSDFKEYISEIIIEGHTDTNGSYFHNLELSQQRAYSVAEYCLDEAKGILTPQEIEELRAIMTANGRSYTNPVYQADGVTVDLDKSRRVEIKFRLKDEEMVQEMNEILNELDSEN